MCPWKIKPVTILTITMNLCAVTLYIVCLHLHNSSSDSWGVLHTYWKEHHCSLQFILCPRSLLRALETIICCCLV